MSDIFSSYNFEKFKYDVCVNSEHSLEYIRKQIVDRDELFMTIHVTNQCLKSWYDFKEVCAPQPTFVDILNAFLRGKHAILIKDDCVRVDNHLRRLTSTVKSKFVGKTGNAYITFAKTIRKIAIRNNEVQSIAEIEQQLRHQIVQNSILQEENESLQERYEEVYQNLLQAIALKTQAEEKAEELYADLQRVRSTNEHLYKYIEKVEELHNLENNGKKITELKERQQRRKLRELKTKVERTLWFAETFGLKLSCVEFKDRKGLPHTMQFESAEKALKSYKDLPQDEQDKVKEIVFITDKFCISEAAYHELTLTSGGGSFPRSYLVRQCKNDLNKLCHITRTPGIAEGAQLDFERELQNKIDLDKIPNDSKLKVKISGDGAKMTRLTNFIIMSFSFVENDDVMSSKGNYTLAVIKGQESYDLLKDSCAHLFNSVNNIVKKGHVAVDGREIPVEMFLGGDYKFLLILLGMKCATSDYACIWCKINKSDRHDMSKATDHYWQEPMVRSLENIKNCAKKQKFSCAHQPLLEIPLENVVLDELHLMLRVTDVLTNNLVVEALAWDQKNNLNKPPSQKTSMHLDNLKAAINDCGVCFNVWEKKNADGKGSGTHDFTSLMGSAKKTLLKHLPPKLEGVIKPETSESVIKIWKDFNELYKMFDGNNPSDEHTSDYFQKATAWVSLFISLGGSSQGYSKAKVTPYMHGMVYHVPRFMKKHQGIKKFTGQGVEKNNDDIRRIHLQKSNKWDAAKDVLLVSKRIETLSTNFDRTPRVYRKRNAGYWETEIKEQRANKRASIRHSVSHTDETSSIVLANMSVETIKARLNELGIRTRFRNVKRLRELLEDTLKSTSNA